MTRSTLSSSFDPAQALTEDHRAQLDAGEKALTEIRTMTVNHWLAAGAAWSTLQHQAMRFSNSQQPSGRRYAEIYARLEQPWPHLTRVDRTTRMDTIWLFDNQNIVLRWLNSEKVEQRDRDRWLHPSTIRKHAREEGLDATRSPRGQPQEGEQRPTALHHATEQIARLRAELDEAETEIRRLKRGADNVSEGRDWTWTDDPAAVAEVWLRLYPSKAPQVASKVLELSKSTARKAPRRTAGARKSKPT